MLTVQDITDAYELLKLNKERYSRALVKSTLLDAELEARKATALASGAVQGKNEAERKAALLVQFEKHIAHLSQAEAETADARLGCEIAEIEVKRIETLVRWLK